MNILYIHTTCDEDDWWLMTDDCCHDKKQYKTITCIRTRTHTHTHTHTQPPTPYRTIPTGQFWCLHASGLSLSLSLSLSLHRPTDLFDRFDRRNWMTWHQRRNTNTARFFYIRRPLAFWKLCTSIRQILSHEDYIANLARERERERELVLWGGFLLYRRRVIHWFIGITNTTNDYVHEEFSPLPKGIYIYICVYILCYVTRYVTC